MVVSGGVGALLPLTCYGWMSADGVTALVHFYGAALGRNTRHLKHDLDVRSGSLAEAARWPQPVPGGLRPHRCVPRFMIGILGSGCAEIVRALR